MSYSTALIRPESEGRLMCTASGWPKPELAWIKNGVQIKGTDRYTLRVDKQSLLLKISPATKEDQGNFTCLATNRLGQDSHLVIIFVSGKWLCSVQNEVALGSAPGN